MSSNANGKGPDRRRCLIPRWLEDLRWDLAYGEITREQYDKIIKGHEDENFKKRIENK